MPKYLDEKLSLSERLCYLADELQIGEFRRKIVDERYDLLYVGLGLIYTAAQRLSESGQHSEIEYREKLDKIISHFEEHPCHHSQERASNIWRITQEISNTGN